MRIRDLSVRNFRGIRELDWPMPDRNALCLIGRGRLLLKSTILEALRRVFYPQWNLTFDDADFHLCNPGNPIIIESNPWRSLRMNFVTSKKTDRTLLVRLEFRVRLHARTIPETVWKKRCESALQGSG